MTGRGAARLPLAAAVGVLLALLTACGGGAGPAETVTLAASPAATTLPTATATPSGPSLGRPPEYPFAAAGPGSDGLTEYAASLAAWSGHHVPDLRYDAGTAYDVDPTLPEWQARDRYSDVRVSVGRVTAYNLNFSSPVTLPDATRAVLQELPADARVLWTGSAGTCAFLAAQSATLGSVLGGNGAFLVELVLLQPDSTLAAAPKSFNQARFPGLAAPANAAGAGGC